MKKIINFLLIITAILTLVSISNIVLAQKNNEIAQTNAQKTSEYALPYPGILPGHPLYSLKMLRDQIVSLFISDTLKKADFYLLMADKRINSGYFLVDQKKEQLGKDAISKGQNYLNKGLSIIENEKKNPGFKSLIEKYYQATVKHEMVLKEILQKVSDEIKPDIRNAIERAKLDRARIKTLIK